MCTWAYGRKLLVIRLVYIVLFAVAMFGLYWSVQSGVALQRSRLNEELIPSHQDSSAVLGHQSHHDQCARGELHHQRTRWSSARLAVGNADYTRTVFDRQAGRRLVCNQEMVILPLALCIYLWWQGGLSGENLAYVLIGLATMNLFVTMLGIHCGMIHAQSRGAIATSLGTVFFLFLGVVMCMLVMLSFRDLSPANATFW